ncbi:hypothetical protein [Pantoea sp. FN0307]|uniref:hypothetical protein n=1 Tax=Pantoea sp. FN0307 TaxID=3418560 RepID=UPI003CF1D4B3
MTSGMILRSAGTTSHHFSFAATFMTSAELTAQQIAHKAVKTSSTPLKSGKPADEHPHEDQSGSWLPIFKDFLQMVDEQCFDSEGNYEK